MFPTIECRPVTDVSSWAVDLDATLRPHADALLAPGEQLWGFCIASQVGMFTGRQVLLVVTDARLVVQPMNRRLEPVDDPISLPPERIARASVDGAGGGWVNVGMAIMDGAAITVKVRTTDRKKLKLMMMRGTGLFGELGGGQTQRTGVDALAAWFTRHPT